MLTWEDEVDPLLPPLNLRFFDVTVQVHCETEAFRRALQQLYRPAECPPVATPAIEYGVGPGIGVSQRCNGTVHRLARGPVSPALAYGLLLSSLADRVRSHWLLHAAAVVGPRGGVLLAGASGSGKTTLALALALRGYGWLSDDVAAVERVSGRLVPFPRGALVRARTLQLLPELRQRAEPWTREEDDAVACWHPQGFGEPAVLRHVFLLPPPGGSTAVEVAVGALPLALQQRLDGEPGLSGYEAAPREGHVLLRWPRRLAQQALVRCAAACRAEGVPFLSVNPVRGSDDFPARPRVSECPTSLAWLRLAAASGNRPLLNEAEPAAPRQTVAFLQECAHMLRHARCYRLRPGPIEATVALVQEVCCAGRGCTPE